MKRKRWPRRKQEKGRRRGLEENREEVPLLAARGMGNPAERVVWSTIALQRRVLQCKMAYYEHLKNDQFPAATGSGRNAR
jgi:hypothetical protein